MPASILPRLSPAEVTKLDSILSNVEKSKRVSEFVASIDEIFKDKIRSQLVALSTYISKAMLKQASTCCRRLYSSTLKSSTPYFQNEAKILKQKLAKLYYVKAKEYYKQYKDNKTAVKYFRSAFAFGNNHAGIYLCLIELRKKSPDYSKVIEYCNNLYQNVMSLTAQHERATAHYVLGFQHCFLGICIMNMAASRPNYMHPRALSHFALAAQYGNKLGGSKYRQFKKKLESELSSEEYSALCKRVAPIDVPDGTYTTHFFRELANPDVQFKPQLVRKNRMS